MKKKNLVPIFFETDLMPKDPQYDFLMETIQKASRDIEEKKVALIKKILEEKIGIEIDVMEETKRRFKNLIIVKSGNEETVYYNDGTPEGLRVVTFVFETTGTSVTDNKLETFLEFKYY